MAETTGIAWTDSSWNPWLGCSKLSEACRFCYAETLVRGRMGLDVWGPDAPRKRTSDSYWRQPAAWNRKAAAEGVRRRVFCGSLCDVMEDHPAILPHWREDLYAIIEETPNLDWLLLTKRPANYLRFLPVSWIRSPRPNVWLGTTVEDQQRADERIPELLFTPAAVRFLSCEPLLGPINLRFPIPPGEWIEVEGGRSYFDATGPGIHWVIVGGESGRQFRPMRLDWARSIRDQCAAAGVPFFFKQHAGVRPKDLGHLLDGVEHRAIPHQ